MTKAEERALDAYPHFTAENMDDVIKARKFFAKGYEQAEKDLTLTTKDLIILHSLLYAVKNKKQGAFTFRRLSDKQYEEILEIYKGIQ